MDNHCANSSHAERYWHNHDDVDRAAHVCLLLAWLVVVCLAQVWAEHLMLDAT
jgi:hypothetical protein